MKKYEILSAKDYDDFNTMMLNFIKNNVKNKKPFQKLNFTVKKWRKDKTPQQLKYYWVVINEMKKAFLEVGYEFTKDEIHEFIKKEHGYTKSVTLDNGIVVNTTKSISDNSDDVNIKIMIDLIDYAIRWTALNLNYAIENPLK